MDRNPAHEIVFLSCSEDCIAKNWHLRSWPTWHSESKLSNPTDTCLSVHRNPAHENVFLSCSGDCTTKIWDLRQPRPTLSIAAHANEILTADWCKYNDCVIATGSVDKVIKVWDIRAPQRELTALRGHTYASPPPPLPPQPQSHITL